MKKFQQMFQLYRYCYNSTLNILERIKETDDWNEISNGSSVSYNKLRDIVNTYQHVVREIDGVKQKFFERRGSESVPSSGFPVPDGMKIMHSRIPRGAIKSLTGNLNSAMSNRKNGNIKEFTLKPKRKKDIFSEECLFEDEGGEAKASLLLG